MPSLRGPNGRIPWPLLAAGLAAQLAVLCLAWALTHSSWLQAALLIASFFPWRTLSARATETNPLPTLTASETRQRELLLIVGFIVLLFGLGAILSQALKTLDIYPGRYTVAYLAAWVPFSVAWNLLGFQR